MERRYNELKWPTRDSDQSTSFSSFIGGCLLYLTGDNHDISQSDNKSNRIARHPGKQGARPPAGNQAGVEKLATGHKFRGKRSLTSSGGSNEFAFPTPLAQCEPRFLIMTDQKDEIKRMSAVTICETLLSVVGETEDTRRLADGSLLIHVRNDTQSRTLMDLGVFAGVSVEFKPHRTLNSCKGIAFSYESHQIPDAQLRGFLQNKGIIQYHRIPTKRAPCELLILTFKGTLRARLGLCWI